MEAKKKREILRLLRNGKPGNIDQETPENETIIERQTPVGEVELTGAVSSMDNENAAEERVEEEKMAPDSEEEVEHEKTCTKRMADYARKARTWVYPVYVLVILLLIYLFNQLDRYLLGIVTREMAQEIHYGDMACMRNTSTRTDSNVTCIGLNETSCVLTNGTAGEENVCEWNYNGQGLAYQLLAGPLFVVLFTLAGLPLGIAADVYNRHLLLVFCLTLWSSATLLTGAVKTYWQLALLRVLLGIGEAGCVPFGVSIIGDLFSREYRGAALGVFNWGIFLGYSMAYAFGNFVTEANILGQGWRWTYYLAGIIGLALAFITLITVKEPPRSKNGEYKEEKEDGEKKALLTKKHKPPSKFKTVKRAVRHFLSPSLLVLCLAGSIRNAGGYVWAYNTEVYYESLGRTSDEIGAYISWIPIVGGLLSTLLGGCLSDRLVVRLGIKGRVVVCVVSLILAAPFAAGALFLSPPGAYLSLIPCYIIGEMWISITLAVVMELVPGYLRTTSIALYLFIISNIGGLMPLLVPPLQDAFQAGGYSRVHALTGALFVLYPGLYLGGAFMYGLALCILAIEKR